MFPFPFVFFSLITHIRFSSLENNQAVFAQTEFTTL